jgi:hypothetical protein
VTRHIARSRALKKLAMQLAMHRIVSKAPEAGVPDMPETPQRSPDQCTEKQDLQITHGETNDK